MMLHQGFTCFESKPLNCNLSLYKLGDGIFECVDWVSCTYEIVSNGVSICEDLMECNFNVSIVNYN